MKNGWNAAIFYEVFAWYQSYAGRTLCHFYMANFVFIYVLTEK